VVRSVTWQQVYARRLRASRLDAPTPAGELLDVARDVLGVHAQLLTGAELALSARVRGVTREGVAERLWQRRDLVKGNTIRGTLHLHPAHDYALWKSLDTERWRTPQWLDVQGITLMDAEHLRAAVLALADEPRTREEIGSTLGGTFGERIAGDSWGHLLTPATADLCQGPPRGRNVTFVRCDCWLPAWRKPPADEALRELVHRYLRTYGPVRRDELEHWFAFRLPKSALDGLEEIDVEGYRTFVLPGTEFPDEPVVGVRLLSHYDVYVIACHPRDHLIPLQKERIFLRGGGPNPALLVDGRVAGVWSRTARRGRVEVRVEPFVELTAAQRAELAGEAERVAATYGATAELVVES
jgi:Winged helix DNA-binding domain